MSEEQVLEEIRGKLLEVMANPVIRSYVEYRFDNLWHRGKIKTADFMETMNAPDAVREEMLPLFSKYGVPLMSKAIRRWWEENGPDRKALAWYRSVLENWIFGENRKGPSGMDLGPMKCPDCEATELVVEPDGYQGEFHSKQHNLRARCSKCSATLAIAVIPILVNSFGSEWDERRRMAKKSRGSR